MNREQSRLCAYVVPTSEEWASLIKHQRQTPRHKYLSRFRRTALATAQTTGRSTGVPDDKFIAGNQPARTTGVYARQQPVDIRLTAQELQDGIVSDLRRPRWA